MVASSSHLSDEMKTSTADASAPESNESMISLGLIVNA